MGKVDKILEGLTTVNEENITPQIFLSSEAISLNKLFGKNIDRNYQTILSSIKITIEKINHLGVYAEFIPKTFLKEFSDLIKNRYAFPVFINIKPKETISSKAHGDLFVLGDTFNDKDKLKELGFKFTKDFGVSFWYR